MANPRPRIQMIFLTMSFILLVLDHMSESYPSVSIPVIHISHQSFIHHPSSIIHHPSFILQHSHFTPSAFTMYHSQPSGSSSTSMIASTHVMTSSSIIQHDFFHHDVPFPANPSHGTLFYRVCTLSFHPKLPEHKNGDLTPRGGPAKGIPLERRGNPSMHGEIHLDHTQCLQVVYCTSKENESVMMIMASEHSHKKKPMII